MGFISQMAGKQNGRALWDRAFGTNKEERSTKLPNDDNNFRGDHGRSSTSITGSTSNLARFLSSYRSKVPGGWSDDRWSETRAFTGITYVALHRTGLQLMQAEFQVFKKDPHHQDGERPLEPHEPEYALVTLLEKPNWKDSFGTMMYRINQQLDLTGTALNWIVPGKFNDQIVEMYTVPTAIAIPLPVQTPDLPQGGYQMQPIYPYGPFSSYPQPYSAAGARVPAEWMIPIQYPHPLLWYDGYSPLTALRLHIDELNNIDTSRWYAQRRGIDPSAVLNFDKEYGATPLPEEEIQRIQAQFEAQQQGPENVGNLFVSTPGAKLEPWGQTPDKMMWESGWDQLTGFILGAMGITKPAAGMVEDSSYATLFATIKQLNLLTLEPKCQLISSILTRRLAQFFGDDLIIKIRCRKINDHEITKGNVDQLLGMKGLPESVIRYCMTQMDMPVDDKMVADLSKAQDQQPGMPGQPGMVPGQEQEQQPAPEPPALGEDENAQVDGGEAARNAPRPGKLGEGSLGPRKGLNGYHTKNGHHPEEVERPFAILAKRLPDDFLTSRFSKPQPNVTVNVDQPQAPQVTVNIAMPEGMVHNVNPAPIVNNIIPPARKVEKQIQYSAQGYPVSITEREVKE